MCIRDSLYLNGQKQQFKQPEDAIEAGMAYVTEDRKAKGLILMQDVKQNITLANLHEIAKRGVVDNQAEIRVASEYRTSLNIKTPSIEQKVRNLSGGNQQKVSLAKSIDPQPIVLIADEPTRGVDVSAKQEIYRFIKSLADIGLSCLFISSEQEEIVGMCHRVVVMKDGRIMGTLAGDEISEAEIMFLATGVHETETETEIPNE